MKRVRRVIVWIVLVAGFLLAGALLVLQFPAARTAAVNAALVRANPWPETRIGVRETHGSVARSLTLLGLRLERDNGSALLAADTLSLEYRLLPMLFGRFRFREVAAHGLALDASRTLEGPLDFLAPFESDPTAPPLDLRVGRAAMAESRVSIADTTGVWEADSIYAVVEDLRLAPSLEGFLAGLNARILDPVTSVPGQLSVRGVRVGATIEVDTLDLRTRRSTLAASGQWAGWTNDSTRAHVLAAPFEFADLHAVLPLLAADGRAELEVRVSTTRGQTVATAHGLLGGGKVDLDLRGTAPDSAQVWGHLALQGVDPGAIIRGVTDSTPLDLSLTAELEGADWATLSGESELRVARGRINSIDISALRIEQTWVEGVVAFAGRGEIRHGQTELFGSISPAVPGLPTEARAKLVDWPLQAWAGDALQGTVNATLDLEGALADQVWTLDGQISESTVGLCGAAGSIRARGRGLSEPVLGRVALELCGGTAAAAGTLRPEDGSWRVDDFHLRDVPVAGLVGDSTRSVISAVLTASGSGDEGVARLERLSGHYADYQLDSLSARAVGSPDSWRLDGEGFTGPGSARFALRGQSTIGRLERLRLANVDLGYTAGLGKLVSNLNADLTGRFDGPEAHVAISLRPSSINGLALIGGSGVVEKGAEGIDTRGLLRLRDDGYLGWRVVARPGAPVEVDSIGFVGLDLSAALRAGPTTRLSGRISGTVDPGHSANLTASLRPVGHVNGLPLGPGELTASVRADSAYGEARLRVGSGYLLASGHLNRDSEGYGVRVQVRDVDALRLAGLDTTRSNLSTSLQLSGSGLELAGSTARGTLDSLRFRHGAIRVSQGTGRVVWSDGVLHLDEFEVQGEPFAAHLNGRIPLGSTETTDRMEFSGTLDTGDVEPIAEFAGLPLSTAGSRISIRGSGTRERFQVSAEGVVEGARFGEIHSATTNLITAVELGPAGVLAAAEISLQGSVLSVPGITADSGHLSVTLMNDSLRYETGLVVSGDRFATVAGGANLAVTDVTLDELDMRLDNSRWSLLAPTRVYLDDGVEIDGLVAAADSQRIALGGVLGGRCGDDFYVAAERVDLTSVADVLGFEGLGARMNATVSVASSGSDQERDVSGTLSGTLEHRGEPAAEVDARLSLRDRRLSLDAGLLHTSGQEMRARGFLPFSLGSTNLSAEPVSMRLETDAFPIGWTLPFFDPALVDELGGQITGDVSVRGTYGEPELTGVAQVTEGRVGIPILGKPRRSMVYDRASAFLTFQDNAVRLDSAYVRSAPGFATASGTVDLQDLTLGEIRLTLRARNFLAADADPYRVIVGADMDLRGTNLAPILSGQVRVEQGDFFLTDETNAAAFEPVALNREDLLALEQRFGIRVTEADTTTFDFYEAMTIEDLQMDLARNSWLRSSSNPRMDIQFTGSLDLAKNPHEDVAAFGSIEVLPERSRFVQFGRRFEIEQGTLTFRGPVDRPEMNLGAVYSVESRRSGGDEVTIRLQAEGRPDDLTVAFTSDPAMELSDIVSYIATGRPASESLQFGGTDSEAYLRSAAGLAVGPITTLVENLAAQELGLDLVEIDQDDKSGFILTAGKYVSPRFFVSVSQPLSLSETASADRNPTAVAMEYEVVQSVLVSLLSRGTVLRVNLRWERAY